MKTLWRRTLNGITPADEAAERVFQRTKPGDFIKVDAVVPRDQRSLAQHNLYMAVMDHVFKNLPKKYGNEISSMKILRKRIAHEIGFTETYMTKNGPVTEARSLEFAGLGQAEFYDDVWTPTMRLLDVMAPGLGEAFENEYLEMVA